MEESDGYYQCKVNDNKIIDIYEVIFFLGQYLGLNSGFGAF
jgi:hypothetical protein